MHFNSYRDKLDINMETIKYFTIFTFIKFKMQ